jgi:glutathione peroxidase-family protein
MEKTDVNGAATNPVYTFLKKSANVGSIPWNFAKFLVDGQG